MVMTNTAYLNESAWGHGLATIASDGTILDTWYVNPQLGAAPKSDAVYMFWKLFASIEKKTLKNKRKN